MATEVEEAVLGECGVAAALAGTGGEVVGAVGLVAPSTDWPLPPAARRRLAVRGTRGVARDGRVGVASLGADDPGATGVGVIGARRG